MIISRGAIVTGLAWWVCAANGQASEVPPPQDVPYVGALAVSVDLTDVGHRLFKVREVIPAMPGPLTLLYPEWLPGNHAPRGPIDALAGLTVVANGRPIPWARDTMNMYAFHLNVPQGTDRLEVQFQYASPQVPAQGRIVATPEIVGLQWNSVLLYPAGHNVSQIRVKPDITLPPGWKFGSALEMESRQGDRVQFAATNIETLVDSPLFAGLYYKRVDLDPGGKAPVYLNIVADNAPSLEIRPDQLAAHRKLMREAYALFGARSFDRYDFLLALSDHFSPIGLEHHRSSENQRPAGYFTEWDKNITGRSLLPHELVHSWNGKRRRPADLWTPNYNVPMQDSLLWVYEGLTNYWDLVLTARSTLWNERFARESLAYVAAMLANNRPGRAWRNLQDTTNQPIISPRRPLSFTSWQRTEDYYNEGTLLWLDVDTKIRELTGERRSLDDFARAFFGTKDGSYAVITYTFDDLTAALNKVAPYDWRLFLRQRLDSNGPAVPLDGVTRGGWKLVFRDEPSQYFRSREELNQVTDLSFSMGFTVSLKDKGDVADVVWGSPAFNAGLTTAMKLIAVNGREFESAVLSQAVRAARNSSQPIELLVKHFDRYTTLRVAYSGGLRYPYLERAEQMRDRLSAILKSRGK